MASSALLILLLATPLNGCGFDWDLGQYRAADKQLGSDPDAGAPDDDTSASGGASGSGANGGSCGAGLDCGGVDESDGDSGTEADTDRCPDDDQKMHPGICGCGIADVDGDSDGTPDCHDNCPKDAQKTEPGKCGCSRAEGTCTDVNNTMALRYRGKGSLENARQKIRLESNTKYHISVDLRAASGAAGYMVFDTNDRFDDSCQAALQASPNWLHFTCTFNSGSFTDVTIRAFASHLDFNGTAYWDNVVVTEHESTTNLVVNGDFEDGLSGWTVTSVNFSSSGESLPP